MKSIDTFINKWKQDENILERWDLELIKLCSKAEKVWK